MKSISLTIASLAIAAGALTSCGGNDAPDNPKPELPADTTTVTAEPPFARGADVSWVTEQEAKGMKWHHADGREDDLLAILADDYDINAIRLRVWVDPADGYNGLDDLLAKARRVKAAGMMLMVDFHFSDTWADPGHQTPPAAWKDLDLTAMKQALSTHVTTVLGALKAEGIEPQWVQVGNETRNGFLWPLGQADRSAYNFASLVTAGYDAVKSVCPDAIVMVHLDQGNVMSHYDYIFGILSTYSARYDMIGMSLYPDTADWQRESAALIANINSCWARWHRPVMICEVGMQWEAADACHDMLTYLLTASHTSTGGHSRGVFYWEPQATPGINGGYDKGACSDDGYFTRALDAFRNDALAYPED